MITDDPVLPAAAHLTGPDADAVLGPALAAAGLELVSSRPTQVQYRPGSDLVVRFRAEVRSSAGVSSETLLAATTVAGPPPGTLPVEAETAEGTTLHVGVWRWPFDPVLTALEAAVTPHRAAELFGNLVDDRPAIEVVAYRPTERAVMRVEPSDGRAMFYAKVVSPATASALIDRHERLGQAGLPVPRIWASGPGWVAMEALTGPTLRDQLKEGRHPWPAPDQFTSLLDRLTGIDPDGFAATRSRLIDAPEHAAMLSTVLPSDAARLGEIADRLRAIAAAADRPRTVIHGDLHEAQLVVDGERVVGLLDIDDVGAGDPLDDIATLVGHLTYRGTTAEAGGAEILEYAGTLKQALAAGYEPAVVDQAVAATLVGLATGPFRIQQAGWQQTTRDQLDLIETLLESP